MNFKVLWPKIIAQWTFNRLTVYKFTSSLYERIKSNFKSFQIIQNSVPNWKKCDNFSPILCSQRKRKHSIAAGDEGDNWYKFHQISIKLKCKLSKRRKLAVSVPPFVLRLRPKIAIENSKILSVECWKIMKEKSRQKRKRADICMLNLMTIFSEME